jgi:uncharacterized membrane protein (UPF0136 family)
MKQVIFRIAVVLFLVILSLLIGFSKDVPWVIALKQEHYLPAMILLPTIGGAIANTQMKGSLLRGAIVGLPFGMVSALLLFGGFRNAIILVIPAFAVAAFVAAALKLNREQNVPTAVISMAGHRRHHRTVFLPVD